VGDYFFSSTVFWNSFVVYRGILLYVILFIITRVWNT
jgi:hypothetical protein